MFIVFVVSCGGDSLLCFANITVFLQICNLYLCVLWIEICMHIYLFLSYCNHILMYLLTTHLCT